MSLSAASAGKVVNGDFKAFAEAFRARAGPLLEEFEIDWPELLYPLREVWKENRGKITPDEAVPLVEAKLLSEKRPKE